MTGEIHYFEKLNSSATTLNLGFLSPGVYLIILDDGKTTNTEKIIKL
jgi:hypothetical protein